MYSKHSLHQRLQTYSLPRPVQKNVSWTRWPGSRWPPHLVQVCTQHRARGTAASSSTWFLAVSSRASLLGANGERRTAPLHTLTSKHEVQVRPGPPARSVSDVLLFEAGGLCEEAERSDNGRLELHILASGPHGVVGNNAPLSECDSGGLPAQTPSWPGSDRYSATLVCV